MTTPLLATCLIVVMIFFTTPANARTSVPIQNHENIAIASSADKALSVDAVKNAIVKAAGTKNWTITYQPDNKMLATLIVRGKHTVVVEISYAADKYSLSYKGSTNMNYSTMDGQPIIHPFYNKWVQDLLNAIRIELLKV